MAQSWMLYGANGYTGELIAEEAVRRGQRPILAGRREDAVRPLAEKLGLDWRVFSLDDAGAVARELEPVAAVLLAAGPFSHTSRVVVDACLRAGRHYLDITGEIGVFEACHRRDAEARERKIVIMPGVGFDVVPSDCLAASLAERLPGADRLELAFHGGSASRGTARTMVEGLGQGGAIRENGKIRRVPFAWRTAEIPFRDKTRTALTIPWGDVSTAWYSTKIPNIVVYMAQPRKVARVARFVRPLIPLLATGPAQRWLGRRIDKQVRGPDETTRRTARSQLWGKVSKGDRSVEGTLETPEGYELTVLASLASLDRLLTGKIRQPAGALTPSMAFGAAFVSEIPGCDLRV